MKKIAVLLSLFALAAQAEIKEVSLKVMCGPTIELVEALGGKYAERPILIGQSETSSAANTTVWYNESTKTFTVLKSSTNGSDFSCVLDSGKNLAPYKDKK